MRVTIAHDKTKEEVVQSVDRSFTDIFQLQSLPVKLTLDQKSWQGSTLTFGITAKISVMSSPITGTIEVNDHDLTIDADLGMFGRFISEDKVREVLGNQLKGLLK